MATALQGASGAKPIQTDYQSVSWILLNGLSCSQPVRYRTNRRAPNLPSRRFEWFNTRARAMPPPSSRRFEAKLCWKSPSECIIPELSLEMTVWLIARL